MGLLIPDCCILIPLNTPYLNNKKLQLLLTCLWAFCITAFTFSDIVFHPGSVMLSTSGDGAKNYYTYLYHILYEHGLWFGGMNYPFGEHLVFADAQPLLSVPLAALTGVSIHQALAAMHLLIACSFMLGIVYTYLTLIRFRVAPLAAALFATLIMMLCPQLIRISGHFALAYMSFVPMLFYYTLCYQEQQQRRYAVYLFLLGAVMYLLHPYYVALVLMWTLFYLFSYLVFGQKSRKEKLRHITPAVIALLLLLGACRLFMLVTDPVSDRPSFPHGAMAYGTRGLDIFTSAYSAFWQLLREHNIVDKVCEGAEGMTYPGLAVLAIILILVFAGILQLTGKRKTAAGMAGTFREQRIWWLMSLLSLLLGMGVPFVWEMDWLLDYFSLFRQFRTLGRFIWLFYQLVTVLAVVCLYHYHHSLRAKAQNTLAWLVLIIPVLFWSYESRGYVGFVQRAAREGRYNYRFYDADIRGWHAFLEQQGMKPADFQAMLLLPYVHIGSEKWSVRGFANGIMYSGFKASLELRLPVADVMMSRTSWSQTAGQVRIAGGPYADKPLLHSGNDRPFLVLQSQTDSISADEQSLLTRARLLGNFQNCRVYACYPALMRREDSIRVAAARNTAGQMQQGDTIIPAGGLFYTDHIDYGQRQHVLFGTGALGLISGGDTMLASVKVPAGTVDQLYELSTWVLLGAKDFRAPVLNLSLLDEQGQELLRQDARVMESFDNKGLWFRTCIWFRLPPACRTINWRLYNDHKRGYIALDEIVLKPAAARTISKDSKGRIMADNHLLP